MNARLALCLIAAASCAPALAHEHDSHTKTAPGATASAPQMSADEMAMMKAWEAAATPGKNHEALEPMEGSFDVKVSSWMDAGAKAMASTGRSESRMIFGGRYLESRFNGTFMNQPFDGIGHMGYDNVKKVYVSTWLDSMSTMIMTSTGKATAAGKTMTFDGECADPMTGKTQPFRNVVTIDGPNKHVMEMWGPDKKTKKDYKMMELVYTRTGTASNND